MIHVRAYECSYLSVFLVSDECIDGLSVLTVGDGSELVIHFLLETLKEEFEFKSYY